MSTVTMTQWIHTVPSHLSHASAVLLPSALSKLKIRVARNISSNKTITLANTYPTIKL